MPAAAFLCSVRKSRTTSEYTSDRNANVATAKLCWTVSLSWSKKLLCDMP